MTKKYIYILFICIFLLILLFIPKEETKLVFNDIEYKMDNYELSFEECTLNTNNFIEIFSYFKDYEYKILEVVPYINESNKDIFNDKFLFYTKDLNYVLENFKNKYTEIMLSNEKYVTNICIKNVRMYISNEYLSKFNYNSTK